MFLSILVLPIFNFLIFFFLSSIIFFLSPLLSTVIILFHKLIFLLTLCTSSPHHSYLFISCFPLLFPFLFSSSHVLPSYLRFFFLFNLIFPHHFFPSFTALTSLIFPHSRTLRFSLSLPFFLSLSSCLPSHTLSSSLSFFLSLPTLIPPPSYTHQSINLASSPAILFLTGWDPFIKFLMPC